MSDEAQFRLLLATENPVELASVQSLLTSASIAFRVHGENHHRSSGGLFGNPLIAPRVMVRHDHSERARELLEARPAAELTEGVCAVHEQAATGQCAQCQAFLCARCRVSDSRCESCAGGDFEAHEQRRDDGRLMRKLVAGVLLAPFVIGLVAFVVVIVLRLAGVLPLR